MNTVWLKRLSGVAVVSLTSLVGLVGCNHCNDDCEKPKRDCDDVRVGATEGEYRTINASATTVSRNTWNAEDQYWRTNYTTRPYASLELSYDEFAPAYRYGYDSRSRYQGQRFDEVEQDLALDWDETRGTSKLSWEQARPAVRDSYSWDRAQTRLNVNAEDVRIGVNADTRPSWETDEQFWRTNYSTRPYAATDSSYDDYSAAYRYGYDSRAKYQGKRFDDVEADMSRGWDGAKGTSKLDWEKAKAATRDSWDRDEARVNVRAGVNGASVNVGTGTGFDSDDQYWRTNYSTRPYFSAGTTYDDYSPAYRYGYESRTKYQGKRFDDVESDMSRGWESAKSTSKLGWDKAKAASRDAWDRADHAVKGDRR